MDVTILCGGYGTRLAGLWDGPKCLVRLGDGRPLIESLVNKALMLKPRKVFLLLGYRASEVVAWREGCCPHRDLVPIIETVPEGTAAAVRKALPLLRAPLLILNGDTLPRYELSDLTKAWHAAHPDLLVAWCGALMAGAFILGAESIERLGRSTEKNLERWMRLEAFGNVVRVGVNGFLDVGTPHGFQLAKEWKG